MTQRERIGLTVAVVLSVAVHAVIAYNVMDLRLSARSNSSLFRQAERTVESVPLSVSRSSEDIIVEETESDDARSRATPELPADDPAALREQAERLLENLDLSDTLEPDDAPDPTEIDEPDLALDEPTHLEAAPPLPGPAAPVDASGRLLATAEPVVSLPEFVAPTDGVTAPTESEEAPASRSPIDPDALGELDDLFASDVDDTGGGGAADGEIDPLAALASIEGEVGGRPGGVPGGTGTATGANARAGGGGTNGGGEGGVPDLTQTLIDAPTATAGDDAEEEATTVHLDDDFTYSLRVAHEFAQPRGLFDLFGGDDEEEDSWFEVRVAPRQSLRRLEPLHKDVVWAIDTSESVSSWYVNQMRSGVRQSLRTLNEGDRFNIIFFSEQVRVLNEDGLLEATEANIERARRFLAEAQPGGGTDVNRALSRLLVRDVPPDRVYQIILLSDGVPTRGTISPTNIIRLITRENDRVAGIYAVGVGDEQDRALLELLAYRNKGHVSYPENPQQTASTIAGLASRLRYPVVRGATFTAAGVDADEIHPQTPRDIYLGEPLSLFGRFGEDARRLSMRISGTNRETNLDLTFTLDFSRATEGPEELPRDWGFWKLHDLYRQMATDGETSRLRDEIEFIRRRYDLRTPY